MFDNVGRTIKILAKVLFGIGVCLSISAWFVLLIKGIVDEKAGMVLLSFIVLICGSLGVWINSILLFGFGSLIENSQIVADSIPKEDDYTFIPPRL